MEVTLPRYSKQQNKSIGDAIGSLLLNMFIVRKQQESLWKNVHPCARLQLACCQAHVITQPAVYLSTYLSIEGKLQTLRRFLHGNGNYVSFLTSKQTFLRHSNKKVVRAICNYSILCDDTNRLEVISSRHYNAKSK